MLLGLTVVLCISEVSEPYNRFIYHAGDAVRVLACTIPCLHAAGPLLWHACRTAVSADCK